MEITKTRTSTYKFLWVALDKFHYTKEFRKIRDRAKYKASSCFKCNHKFSDNEIMSLAAFVKKPNRMLCHDCAVEVKAALDAEPKQTLGDEKNGS